MTGPLHGITTITYLLSLNEEGAEVFCEPLANTDNYDHDEILNIIYSAFMSKVATPERILSASINNLIESSSFGFMVYLIKNGNREIFTDINTWAIEIEINGTDYERLKSNLSKKLRAVSQIYKKRRMAIK